MVVVLVVVGVIVHRHGGHNCRGGHNPQTVRTSSIDHNHEAMSSVYQCNREMDVYSSTSTLQP